MRLGSLLIAGVLVVAAGVGLYYQAPELLREPLLEVNRATAGLTERTVEVGDHRIHYLEGGQGETLVLLHGIFAEKDHWVDFARSLTGQYHVIALDLPGFGESTRLPGGDYSYGPQLQRLQAIFAELGLAAVHLAGNSMGGTIAALYAIDHPEQVLTLAFIGAPHGIRSATPSDMDRMIEANQVALVAHNADEFEAMLDLVFAQRPLIPWPIYVHSRDTAISQAEDNTRIFQRQLRDRYLLESQLPLIRTPTLALWGAQDRIFDISGAEVLRRELEDASVEVLDSVGHLPQMEVPKATASAYSAFLAKR